MAINYTNLFTRLGGDMGLTRAAVAANNTIAMTDIDTVQGNYDAVPSWAGELATLRTRITNILSAPVFASMNRLGSTTLIETLESELAKLSPRTDLAALEALIADMVTESETIEETTVSANITAGGSNAGTGDAKTSVVLTSTTNRVNAYAETIVLTCVVDRASGLQYSGNEVWNFAGEELVQGFDVNWPKGSGVSGSFRTCSAQTSSGQIGPNQSAVIGGGFEQFTGGVPYGFEAVTGSALMSSSSDALRGDFSAQVEGDGSTQYQYRQKFGQASEGAGTNPTMLQPNERYLVGVWLKRGGAATAGVIRLSLKNGAGTVLGSVSVNATSLTTSFVYYSFQYLTGNSIDPNAAIVIESTTAIPNGEIIRHDELTCVRMVEAYPSGPLFAVVAGGTDYAVNDVFELAVSNNRNGIFQKEFARMFPDIMSHRLVLPYAGSPTISDALVTV